jgi:hypothetical protein
MAVARSALGPEAMASLATVPDDLTVDIRNGQITLTSQGRCVVIDYGRGGEMFRDGPVPWQTLLMAYVWPALLALKLSEASA